VPKSLTDSVGLKDAGRMVIVAASGTGNTSAAWAASGTVFGHVYRSVASGSTRASSIAASGSLTEEGEVAG